MVSSISKCVPIIKVSLLIILLPSCTFFAHTGTDHPALLKPVNQHVEWLLKNHPETVKGYLDSVFKKIAYPGPGDLYMRYEFLRRYYFEKEINYAKSSQYADSIIKTLQPYANSNKHYSLWYAKAHFNKADILFNQKQYSKAYLEYYNAKISLKQGDRSCDNTKFLFEFYNRLGDISYGKRLFLDAASWHKQAVAIMRACYKDSVQYLPGTLNNIGLNYSFAGKQDSALFYYAEALRFLSVQRPADSLHKMSIESTRAVIIGNIGSVYFLQGKPQQAEQKFLQDININSRKGYATGDALVTRLKLTELYLSTNRLPLAKQQLQLISSSADTLYEPQDKLQLIKIKAAYAKATGKSGEAYNLLQQYINMLNALRNANRNLMLTDFSREFELLEHKFELRDLRKENQLKSLFLTVSIVIITMAVALISLVLKSNRQTKANAKQGALHNRQLEMTLSALEKSNAENTQVLSVVAHDLKNPISAIHGISAIMLAEDSRNEEDREMLELIKLSSKNLDAIIHDLLAKKINKAAESSHMSPTSLSNLLKESISLL
jgi:signal transduction histidine kinase